MLAVVKGKAGRGQRSTTGRGSKGGSAKAKASTQGKTRPRKRSKVNSCCTRLTGSIDAVQLLHPVVLQHGQAMHTCNCGCVLQVVQYVDDDDIDGMGGMYDDDDADDDFKAPGTSAAARKRLEPML